jgi:hypothetical protein
MAKDRLSRPDRPDGRFSTTAGFVQYLLRQRPKLAFNPTSTADEFLAWRRAVRRKLRELLAFPEVLSRPAPRMVSDTPREGYRLQQWELYPEPGCMVPFLMLVPDSASPSHPAPAVLCFPGSLAPKEALCGEPWQSSWENRFGEHNFMARHFVRAGFVALAFDNPGTASVDHPLNKGTYRNSAPLIWLGRSYEGLSTFHKKAVLEWLRTLEFVDRRRIAVSGHSLGAKPALLLALLEPAVRAVVWNDVAIDWRLREAVTNLFPIALWHYIPGFALWFDYADLMAALAPTPLLIAEGGSLDVHARIRKAYAITGAARNLKITFMPNFRDPGKRYRKRIPEGVRLEDYGRYANYDGDHYFKEDIAVPWLRKVLDC